MKSSLSRKIFTFLLLTSIIFMLYSYQSGYQHALNWEITTIGEIVEFPALQISGAIMDHQIMGEKYVLQEEYTGGAIKRSIHLDQIMLAIQWLGFCIVLAAATRLKRFAFFLVAALFALFMNRLNLSEVGLFGIESRLVLLIPFLSLLTPLVIFHEYKPNIRFPLRLLTLLGISALLLIGVSEAVIFTDHLLAHSLFGWVLMAILFLFFISEEIVFGILYVVTSTKGGKNNHIHFLLISLLYLGNLGLYYLNKSGLFENNFFLFDPFLLLSITACVSLWSMKFKARALKEYLSENTLYLLLLGFGIVTFFFLSHHMLRGNDGIYQAFDYLVLYFHLGIGAFFFLYTIANFVDPLIEGFEVHKIIYKERNLPYASARFVGLIAAVAFYLLGAQEPYNLIKGGYYNYMGQIAKDEGNPLLEKEYYLQAGFLGFNTHYANYQLAQKALQDGDEFEAKIRYFKASQRFPSPYSLVNYGNLDREINPNKVRAIYQEALRTTPSGEVENNLGLIMLENKNYVSAIQYFENAKPLETWNNAPLLNKWCALSKSTTIDSSALYTDFQLGNYGVRANILSSIRQKENLSFEFSGLEDAPFAHRRAYLLNSSYHFHHDSLEAFSRREITQSQDGGFAEKLQLALALNLYQSGRVNDAFTTLDYLIANAPAYTQGRYFDVLAKLALDQGALQLSIDYFDQAINAKYSPAKISKLDALILQGKEQEIPDQLLKIVKANPSLTRKANILLEQLELYARTENSKKTTMQTPALDTLSTEKLIKLGEQNAFLESQVIAVIEELNRRDASGGYEILLTAIQINPYSASLLKKYCMTTLNWNLTEYGDQALQRLKPLLSEKEFELFTNQYRLKKQELADSSW